MPIRNTIIAFVALLVVGGVIYFTHSRTTVAPTHYLFNVKPDALTRLTLKYPNAEIDLVREAGKWQLVKPVSAPADNDAVQTLAQEIAQCQIERTVDEHPASLAPFGLAQPQATIIAATKAGALPAIEVGKTTPVGYNVYIKTSARPAVMITAAAFGPGTKRTANDLRDHTLLSFSSDDVKRFVIQRPNSPAIEVDKQAGQWAIVKPARFSADQRAVRDFLNSLSNSRINEFVNDHPTDLAKYGLVQPKITVTIYRDSGKPLVLDVGGQIMSVGKEGFYVQRDGAPAVYSINSWMFADLDKDLNDLRDKTVLAFEPSDVERIQVTQNGNTFNVVRKPAGKWYVESNGGSIKALADPVKVEQFMDHLRTIKGDQIAQDSPTDLSKFGLAAPGQQITLYGQGNKSLGWVKFAKLERHEDNKVINPTQRIDYYAMSSQEPTVYGLYEASYRDLDNGISGLQAISALPAPVPAKPAKQAASGAPKHS
ncbi:MAG TPA: DUF4340 domain-containing protein [Candidatus Binataceae bacterium]|nr:DUF4340 domain-containing protein [Candidatus Binataceae bacterium]